MVTLHLDRTGTEATRASFERVFHVTVLSNFARGYDKYRRQYRKRLIAESTYPNEFYVLGKQELAIGIGKASRLLDKLALPGDRLLVLEAALPSGGILESPRGVGRVWPSSDLPITRVHELRDGELAPLGLEDAMAASLVLHEAAFAPYAALRPRSVSFLPIAKGCQAACPFCFSDSSVSSDQPQKKLAGALIERWLSCAVGRGAERAVITGGGEPTLLAASALVELVQHCAAVFPSVVLISNGYALATAAEPTQRLRELRDAGLGVLAISRHHADVGVNAQLMQLDTQTPRLFEAFARLRQEPGAPRLRAICVLQRGGVATLSDVEAYVTWATAAGVDEVCFKELYVSTSAESVYHSHEANRFSAEHQVPLSVVHDWAEARAAVVSSSLPWGAPIFETEASGRRVRVAAYTEPSLFWERSHGIARSWNVMADGSCLASLEDRQSALSLPELEAS